MKQDRMPWGLALATATLLGLSACGGGGGDSAPTATTTTFSGTAATGAAMANATVSITCASGSGTTTTATNGSYTKDLTGIALPCALRAASSDGTTMLYSVTTATATGSSSQVANITPLTQLLVASLAGTDPAAFFTNFSASTASSVTASSVSAAQAAVLTTLSNAGLDVSSLQNLLTDTLVAATSSTRGNAHDLVLDALKTQLTNSGTTLATLTTAVAAAASPAATVTTSSTNTASLPASQLLKTADSNCSALRTGDYWAITPTMGGTIADQFTSGSYDATTKKATNLAGNSTVFKDSGKCNYLAGDGVSNIVVSQAGMVVARYQDHNSVSRLGFAIPKQTIALSELAGTWNALNFERNDAGTSYAARSFTATISSTGVVSDVTSCNGASTSSICSAETPTINFSSNSAGGFDIGSTAVGDAWTDRAFAYRAGNGDLMLVEVAGDGSVSTWTKKRTLSPPAAGTNQGGSWSVRTLSTLVANALSTDTNTVTVTAINSDAGSFTRSVNLANGTADYSETILLNTPRVGYNFRAAGSTTSTFDGRSVNLRERTNLGLRGMGVTVQSIPVQTGITSAGFQMTVDQP